MLNKVPFTDGKPRTVAVVIPCLNEEGYITDCVNSVLAGDYPLDKIEILVVDGGSTDKTTALLREPANRHSNLKVFVEPGLNCPAAMNFGIQQATAEIICKVDAHGYVDKRFISNGVELLSSDENIKCVGGPIRTIKTTIAAQANTLARASIFGVGRGIYSTDQKAQFVDTVQCGIYEKEVFAEVGGFDESLQFGEDEELNWRIIRAGHKIFLSPEIKFHYYPRDSFNALFKQYYNYGHARTRVIRKHPDFLRIKHLIPPIFVFSLAASLVLSFVSFYFLWVFLMIFAPYLLLTVAASTAISAREGWSLLPRVPVSFGCLHFGYGLGFLRGLADVKRLFDIFLSLSGLVVVGPLLILLSLAVLVTSGRPIFFRQLRVGRYGRPFYLNKFRTMTNEITGPPLTAGNDARITKFGGWLRRYKLDELPQLINILYGDMSFVGPRPEVPRYVELFQKEYARILTVRPGLTDPASIFFRHESALLDGADPEKFYIEKIMPEKLRKNLEYVRTRSLPGDIVLIFRTLAALYDRGSL